MRTEPKGLTKLFNDNQENVVGTGQVSDWWIGLKEGKYNVCNNGIPRQPYLRSDIDSTNNSTEVALLDFITFFYIVWMDECLETSQKDPKSYFLQIQSTKGEAP